MKPIIIQIRGTSGSGKTWVMKHLLTSIQPYSQIYTEGRKKPLYYTTRKIAVLGHYESACGGCDNIGSAPKVYDLIHKVTTENPDIKFIVCEGLLLSEDVKWTSKLVQEGFDCRIYFLTTSIETCIRQILNRRKAAGNPKKLSETNTRNRVFVIDKARLKLQNLGILACRRMSSRQALTSVISTVKEG